MKAYLISGRTGAGKTTISKRLAEELPALRISHDELLVRLYGSQLSGEEFRLACERVNALIFSQIEALSRLNDSVVLEGFGSRAVRNRARQELRKIGVAFEFIYVDCPREVRWQRVQERNKKLQGEGFFISHENFLEMEQLKEEFDQDEEGTVGENSGDFAALSGVLIPRAAVSRSG